MATFILYIREKTRLPTQPSFRKNENYVCGLWGYKVLRWNKVLNQRWKIRRFENNIWYLTHWGRVTHICVGNLTIIDSDNGLSPGRRQAIIWTNAGILLIGPLGTNFSEILAEIITFSFKKMYFKVSSAKWRPFCLGLNVLIFVSLYNIKIVNHIPKWLTLNEFSWLSFWWKLQQAIIKKMIWQSMLSGILVLDLILCDLHDDVMKWKHFPRYWPFVPGIHRSPVNFSHKGQCRGAFRDTIAPIMSPL